MTIEASELGVVTADLVVKVVTAGPVMKQGKSRLVNALVIEPGVATADPVVDTGPVGAADFEQIFRDFLPQTVGSIVDHVSSEGAGGSGAGGEPVLGFGGWLVRLGIRLHAGDEIPRLARAMFDRLTGSGGVALRLVPVWFQPAMGAGAVPVVATLTQFSKDRNRYVNLADKGIPIVLSRHGRVVAAVIPLVEGTFEQEMYAAAARQISEVRRASQDELAVALRGLSEEEWAMLLAAEDKIDVAASFGIELPAELACDPDALRAARPISVGA